MMFRRLCSLVNCLPGSHIKSVAVKKHRSLPKSPNMSRGRELSQKHNCLVSRPISQGTSPMAKPAAPRVVARAIARTAIIYNEQRIPSEDELVSLASSSSESWRLANTGPLTPALQTYLTQPDSSTAFTLDQQSWTHLAGNNTRWSNRKHRQDVDDRPLYAPLDEARREIRVLKISRADKGGDDGGDIFQADLVCVSLDDNPAYLAISYVWSDPSIVGHFDFRNGGHGKRVPYNKAVFDIINTILGRDTTLYLWIDALCINQEDLNERASQVAMMGRIYSQARQVIAFIGEADETLITAMDLILLTGNCIWANGPVSDPALASWLAILLSEIEPADRDWESIKGLTSRPWFRRLWVVQEIALGKDPVVVCGEHVFPWGALYLFIAFTYAVEKFPVLRSIAFSFDALLTVFECLPNAASISEARQGQRNDCPKPPFIDSLVALNVNFDSTDPRDRIYALLGLDAAEKYRDVFRPDYEIKVEDLYVKVAQEMIVKEDNIRLLHLAGISYQRSLNLPSWVPDWTSLPKNLMHYMNLSGHWIQEGYTEVHQPRFSFDPSSSLVLTLYGRFNDSIALITRDPYPGLRASRERPYYETAAPHMDAVMRLVHATHPESVGKPLHELPWLKQLMETLSITGSPLGDYWTQWHKVVYDDLGTARTWTATEVGFLEFLERLRRWSCDRYVAPETSVEEYDFGNLFLSVASGRRFYVSSAGHFGLATGDARVGDYVCMFEGHRVPFVVRPVDEADMSKGVYLVGEAVSTYSVYCHHHERIWSGTLVGISLPTSRSLPRFQGCEVAARETC